MPLESSPMKAKIRDWMYIAIGYISDFLEIAWVQIVAVILFIAALAAFFIFVPFWIALGVVLAPFILLAMLYALLFVQGTMDKVRDPKSQP